MMVPIPEAVGDFVDRQVASGAYKDAVAYIRALVEADRKRQAREHLEMLLVRGVESGKGTEMTYRDWDRIQRDGIALIGNRKPKHAA
ncbi:MAG TPA: hypothetical protein VMG40_01555 [Bryobacteraceae bacterium]|nr:hypothetical protein [Bryobacteraceae bacterium]